MKFLLAAKLFKGNKPTLLVSFINRKKNLTQFELQEDLQLSQRSSLQKILCKPREKFFLQNFVCSTIKTNKYKLIRVAGFSHLVADLFI